MIETADTDYAPIMAPIMKCLLLADILSENSKKLLFYPKKFQTTFFLSSTTIIKNDVFSPFYV